MQARYWILAVLLEPQDLQLHPNGARTFEVRAKDSSGNVDSTPAQTSWTIDTTPPQTTIDTPTPSYTSHETWPVDFSASEEGASFKCGFDEGETPTKACSSAYELSDAKELGEGWHTFVVAATDEAGNPDPTPAKWSFNTQIYPTVASPTTSKLTSPEEGDQSADYFTLKAQWGEAPEGGGVTGVTFQSWSNYKDRFETIPSKWVLDGEGKEVSWPIPVSENPGTSEPVYFDASKGEAKNYWAEHLKIRAILDGGPNAAGATEPVAVYYSRRWGSGRDAVENIGPASLDLVTGYYTMARTDVSIPVPGTDSTLEFTRTYSSGFGRFERNPGNKVLGPMWQSSAPVEAEYEEEAWQKVVVRHEDAVPPKYDPVCQQEVKEYEEELKEYEEWEGPVDPETCLEEYEIPEANWVEVLDSQGAGIPFDRTGTGPYTYVPPEEAKEYTLTKPGANFILADANGTRTEFSQFEATNEYHPSAVSFQGTEKESRLVYEVAEGKRQLKKIIGPAPAGVTCNPFEGEGSYAPKTAGCRSLTFNYSAHSTYEGTVDRLDSITYYNSSGSGTGQIVAKYEYDSHNLPDR